MTFLIALAVVLMLVLLVLALVAKNRGTDIRGLLKVDVSKYTKLIDKVN